MAHEIIVRDVDKVPRTQRDVRAKALAAVARDRATTPFTRFEVNRSTVMETWVAAVLAQGPAEVTLYDVSFPDAATELDALLRIVHGARIDPRTARISISARGLAENPAAIRDVARWTTQMRGSGNGARVSIVLPCRFDGNGATRRALVDGFLAPKHGVVATLCLSNNGFTATEMAWLIRGVCTADSFITNVDFSYQEPALSRHDEASLLRFVVMRGLSEPGYVPNRIAAFDPPLARVARNYSESTRQAFAVLGAAHLAGRPRGPNDETALGQFVNRDGDHAIVHRVFLFLVERAFLAVR